MTKRDTQSSEMIVCPKCDTVNPSGYEFCGQCGAPLSVSESKQAWYIVYFLFFSVLYACSGGVTLLAINLAPEVYDIFGYRALPYINILGWIGLILFVAFTAVTIGLFSKQQWAVKAGKALCMVLMIAGFPIGTLVFGIGYNLIKDVQFSIDGNQEPV